MDQLISSSDIVFNPPTFSFLEHAFAHEFFISINYKQKKVCLPRRFTL